MAITIDGKEYVVRKLKARDIPAASRILKKMDMKIDFNRIMGNMFNTEATQKALGAEFMLQVLTNIGEAEEELFALIGSLIGMSASEAAELELESLADVFNEIKDKAGIAGFLKLLGASMK